MNESIERQTNWLPTQRAVDANPNLFLSDHAPVAASILLDNNNYLKIITLNIYGGSGAGKCGYNMDSITASIPGMKDILDAMTECRKKLNDENNPTPTNELKNQMRALDDKRDNLLQTYDQERFKRIAKELQKTADTLGYDVLLLQECTPESITQFKDTLEDEWVIVPSRNKGSVASFYRKSKYSLQGDVTYPNLNANGNPEREDIKDSQTFMLQSLSGVVDDSQIVQITNLWGQHHYNDMNVFKSRARNIDEILYRWQDGVAVVAGDFNIAVDDNNYIDGVMYKKQKGEPKMCDRENVFRVEVLGATVDENPQGTFKPGQTHYRDEILASLNKQISRLEKSTNNTWCYLYLNKSLGLKKIEALEELRKRIQDEPMSSQEEEYARITRIISTWETAKIPSTDSQPSTTRTYRDIIELNRNRFLSQSRAQEFAKNWSDSKAAIEDIKIKINNQGPKSP